jgi:5-methylcytosine-specific restriction enzyme subunit McrC
LNDAYVLEVGTRVPVGNLERLVGKVAGYTPTILQKYTRLFAHVEERPEAFVDVLTDQLLDVFDQILSAGFLKTYKRDVHVGSSPTGRVMPFQTEWLSAKVGRPTAAWSSFARTVDFGPNRILRHAFEKLIAHYSGVEQGNKRTRTLRLKKALVHLSDVGLPSSSDLTSQAVEGYIRNIPVHHEHYADALIVGLMISFDIGVSIRETGGAAIMPSILIDMEKIFENYIRRVVAEGFAHDRRVQVKDGNNAGDGGAKLFLYDPVRAGLKNPPVAPDIVIEVDSRPVLVIEAKYKRAPDIPSRDDVNQVIVYGARYRASRVMVLHPERPQGRNPAEWCGGIGDFEVFNGMVNLHATPIEDEEAAFVAAVRTLIF